MFRRNVLMYAAAAASTVALSACGSSNDGPGNIVDVAQSRPELSILVEAVVAAGLVDTLKSAGPFTVLAPTNNAFAALLTELNLSKDQLLANVPLLTAVLKYHVIAAAVPRAAIPLGKQIKTVEGDILKIDESGGNLVVTDGRNRASRIVAADIDASNGVVHEIDRVLLPPNMNIVQTAQSVPSLSILVQAVVAANLQATLSGPGPFTVFAPTNDAFAALLTELGVTQDALLANTALLTKVLTYHVVAGEVLKAEIPFNTPIKTVEGETLSIGTKFGITDQRGRLSNIVVPDVLTSNGVVHVVDKVILPAA